MMYWLIWLIGVTLLASVLAVFAATPLHLAARVISQGMA